jgi:hypothetical protein
MPGKPEKIIAQLETERRTVACDSYGIIVWQLLTPKCRWRAWAAARMLAFGRARDVSTNSGNFTSLSQS